MIYVLVPAHNEAATVGLLLWKVRQLFTSFNREYQLIVVNDGSTDATDEILAPYTRVLPMTLLTHRVRQGYARSIEALLREAIKRSDRPRRDLAVTLQADFSESPDEALELIKRLEGGADIVVADRRRRQGAARTESIARRTLAAVARRRLGVTGADDLVGTMRGYRVAVIERLVREHGDRPFLGHQGWAADLELLARAARHARTIESVAVSGERTVAARPSRLSPLAEAWRAYRAAVALEGLPRPDIVPGAAPVEKAERAAPTPTRQQQRGHRHGERAERGERGEAGGHRGNQGRSGGRDRRGGSPKQPTTGKAARAEPRERHQAVAKSGPATPGSAEGAVAVTATPGPSGPSESSPAGQGGRKRRRRRGRGRGRGRGQETQRPDQSLPAPPPSPPSAA